MPLAVDVSVEKHVSRRANTGGRGENGEERALVGHRTAASVPIGRLLLALYKGRADSFTINLTTVVKEPRGGTAGLSNFFVHFVHFVVRPIETTKGTMDTKGRRAPRFGGSSGFPFFSAPKKPKKVPGAL